ncbi:T9SS C-terminal target domain-containing protein [Flavobacterium circumlabens]|uniref:Secreted protein (Por secretion system target) n=1 Tax=Flavobacterium circumlabens TaxID=2133765 RepID=A0A4Y7UEK3_9FLAO|nr:T9SS type A sorting domain-containing protein [Flavobacterium circumlabens]TCN59514.1 putative secreted protein (Por secretion system target) [Flavobacterium circumlabens]TEB44806.1 T9SS C-terminal target domain-containing protein [Flavobacterium circumlabens]
MQWGITAFEVSVFQSLSGIVNGNYTMKAWVRSSGGQSAAVMYAKNYGGSPIESSLNTSSANWTEVQINNIIVTNNSCELGFYQFSGGANKFLDYDDVEFYLTSASSANNTLSSKTSSNISDLNPKDLLENNPSAERFAIYPNPVKSGGTLNIQSNDKEIFDVSIIDLNGKVVYSELNSNNSALLKVPNLNKGLYFLRLTSANKVKIKKIFIE